MWATLDPVDSDDILTYLRTGPESYFVGESAQCANILGEGHGLIT